MNSYKKTTILILIILLISSFNNAYKKLPKGFVDVSKIIPNLKLEMRYASSHNFIGEVIDGYKTERCILSKEAAKALANVEMDLYEMGLCLYVYDTYRPQKAVSHFSKWAKNINDTLMKKEFYPKTSKKLLFKKGYISSKSRHSSGSTIDCTLFSSETNEVLDMGSSYDYFGKESWVNYKNLSLKQKSNRVLLQLIMKRNGFRSYSKEWWHFTLKYEPYRNQYFDFDIE